MRNKLYIINIGCCPVNVKYNEYIFSGYVHFPLLCYL